MRIVLLRCPWITVQHPPDIGLAYVIASLKMDGHEVLLFDLNIEFFHKIKEEDKRNLKYSNHNLLIMEGNRIFQEYSFLVDDAIEQILKQQPEIVGFNVWLSNGEVSMEFARRLKTIDPSIYTIFGGPDVYPLWSGRKYIKEDAVDLIVYGEAEITFKKVLDNLIKFKKVYPIPGTLIRDNGNEVDGGLGEVAKNLDELPMPALEYFPLLLYANRGIISFTRGCVHKCEYCSREMYPQFRWRSPQNIIKEIEYRLKANPEIKNFVVCDAALNANLQQIRELCNLIIDRNLKFSLNGFAFNHPGIDYNFLVEMKKAGFNDLVYGVESGSEQILKKLGKKIKLEVIERSIKESYNAGINVSIDILVGLPGETDYDFKQTLDFLIRNRTFIKKVGVNYFTVMPYSYIYDNKANFEFIPYEVISERIRELTKLIKSLGLSETVESGFNIEQHE